MPLGARGMATPIVIEGERDFFSAVDSLELQDKDRDIINAARELDVVGGVAGTSAFDRVSGTTPEYFC